jgi:putative ABC transport system substrate-binding protein
MLFDQLKRREFITLLGGAAAVWPLAAHAQQPKVPTIGALVIGNINPEQFWREFRQGLRDLGYVEGKNIRFEFRSAEGHLDRLSELAAELVRLKVDIIVTWFTPTALAAKQATDESRSSWPRPEIPLVPGWSRAFLDRAEMSRGWLP